MNYMSNYFIKIVNIKSDKNKNWLLLQEEYLKFLKKWSKVEIVELKGLNYKNLDKKTLLLKESQIWQKYIDKNLDPLEKVVALCPQGRNFTTKEFSKFLGKYQQEHLVFVIGGPYGLTDNILEKADLKLSLSALTFNHQLAKLILLEQLYRGIDLQHQGNYHK